MGCVHWGGRGLRTFGTFAQNENPHTSLWFCLSPVFRQTPGKLQSTATRVIVGLGRLELPKGLPEKRAAFPLVSTVKKVLEKPRV